MISLQKADICSLVVLWWYLALIICFHTLLYYELSYFHHYLRRRAKLSLAKYKIQMSPVFLGRQLFSSYQNIFFPMIRESLPKELTSYHI
jgi:hypothetical protein